MYQDTTYLLKFYTRLTERQQQVVKRVYRGLPNHAIADELCIQRSVVAEHLTNIYELLYCADGYDHDIRPNRYVIVSLFTLFFHHHPELLD